MTTVLNRRRKSEKMTSAEKSKYKTFVSKFDTKIDAAAFFGFSVTTLDAVLTKGCGNPDTIKLIREKINAQA